MKFMRTDGVKYWAGAAGAAGRRPPADHGASAHRKFIHQTTICLVSYLSALLSTSFVKSAFYAYVINLYLYFSSSGCLRCRWMLPLPLLVTFRGRKRQKRSFSICSDTLFRFTLSDTQTKTKSNNNTEYSQGDSFPNKNNTWKREKKISENMKKKLQNRQNICKKIK